MCFLDCYLIVLQILSSMPQNDSTPTAPFASKTVHLRLPLPIEDTTTQLVARGQICSIPQTLKNLDKSRETFTSQRGHFDSTGQCTTHERAKNYSLHKVTIPDTESVLTWTFFWQKLLHLVSVGVTQMSIVH